MALENLEPENRVERLLSGADLDPATRLEYFLKQAGGGSGSNVIVYPLDLDDPVYLYSFNDFRTFLTQGKMVLVNLVSNDPTGIPTYAVLTALGFQNNFYQASFGNSETNVSALLVAHTATEPMYFD